MLNLAIYIRACAYLEFNAQFFGNFALLGVLCMESIATTCKVYGPFMDQELQNQHEKNDTSRLTGFYRILQVGNLEKLAKT